MASVPDRDVWLWPRNRLRIAQVLVDADGPMPGSAIGLALNMDTSNVNKELRALKDAELVSVRPPDPEESTVGRPSRSWLLDTDQRMIAEQVLAENEEPRRPTRRPSEPTSRKVESNTGTAPVASADTAGTGDTPCLSAGFELVFAAVPGSRVVDLMAVLAAHEHAPRPAWTALVGDELVFAFDKPDPPTRAIDLMGVLKSVSEGRIRRSTVARVWPGDEFKQQAATSAGRR